MNAKTLGITLIYAFVGWIFCAVTMGIGISVTTIENTLYIHAILAPIFFSAISVIYFRRHNHLSPVITASIFVVFVILIDFFIVALLINRSLEMFSSFLGTWIPFTFIFISTYLTGIVLAHKRKIAA